MKPTESRKSNKPIMEKRRRARINQCLNELKTLILEALRKDPSRHSKLEKADILEMTVNYLQNLQRQQMALTMATNPQIMSKYRAGFGECVAEVSRFLSGSPAVDTAVQQRLISHLNNNFSGLESISDEPVNLGIPMATLSTSEFRRSYRGLQLIPTRLPGGDVVFFVPSNSPFVSSYSSTVPLTPSDKPLSIQVSSEQEIDDKNAESCDVAEDLSTNLSVSSSGSDSPQTPPDEEELEISGDPWRPW
uniref:BHLH domain-containing protein n=1 Tax=Strigamia maritima TaxID=126957 RepID=T1JGI4_STRMM